MNEPELEPRKEGELTRNNTFRRKEMEQAMEKYIALTALKNTWSSVQCGLKLV